MAAPLETINDNGKQLQAIRELTNEIFNLKNQRLQDYNKFSDEITTLQNTNVIVKPLNGSFSVSIEAGEDSTSIIFSAEYVEGYKPLIFIPRRYTSSGYSTYSVVTVLSGVSDTSTPSVTLIVKNLTQSDVSLYGLNGVVIYSKRSD